MPGQIPEHIRLYRLIHWKNVEHILLHGLCYSGHPQANHDFIKIGHGKLISDRHNHPIPLPDAGILGEYIPFYFGPYSPMLLQIKTGNNFVEKRPQEDIVYLVSSVAAVKLNNLEYCFTDRHAKRAMAGFYRGEPDLDKIDWEIVDNHIWKNTPEYRDRQDFKQAEFLVRYHVPISCIKGLIVKSEERKLYFEEMIANLELPIKIHLDTKNQFYYP